MDDKDLRILKAIGTLESGSPDKIADETGIPKSTVHYRLEKLQEEGIIKNEIFDIDFEQAGLNLTLITEVWAEYDSGYHRQVGDKLGDINGVNQVYFTLGDTDFILISHLASRGMVEELISEFEDVDEISRTSSKFVITTIKDESNPLNDYDIEGLKDALLPDLS
ncbi:MULTISPECIES: Lrp/AsnC family transcriptional regulator [unclassified Haladaptatus]|uniref:Lrp/AsnC family transcriptional regulator n=1 Tax=unclassified Haladaptatus TaxID=2622732 RepID=UPI00209C4CF7|nr:MULTISPECIES: Lrp/AsnC family transcriptional regulator [unclassified Haladaptatus]MCO8244885.1 Lrp/AsnC family transcriptional regulator [Haladaptatus sp. AB643]MCO8255602.1 Lrp/AsnC family transcriptional regulator [Haladaptatus sp. AB618]